MSVSQRKATFLATLRAEHSQLEALLGTLREEQMLRPGMAGEWSVKEVLVHLSWWEQDLLRRIAASEPLDPETKSDLLAVDHANAWIVEAQCQTPLAQVLAEFERSYQQVLSTAEAFREEDLAHEEIYTYMVMNTSAHYAEHRVWITAGLRARPGLSLAARYSDELW